MNFVAPEIEEYALAFSQAESSILKKISRETYSQVIMPRMLSGHLQGRILALLSKMIAPKQILEIGTYTGYSALCLAEGLAEGGVLHTMDINEELEDRVRGYFAEAGVGDKIKYYVGNALEMIPLLSQTLDLVFIDADKINYASYYELVVPKVRSGGIIIADNVLWRGKVLKPLEDMDKDTFALHLFNQKVKNDLRTEPVMVPVRDGLFVIRKK